MKTKNIIFRSFLGVLIMAFIWIVWLSLRPVEEKHVTPEDVLPTISKKLDYNNIHSNGYIVERKYITPIGNRIMVLENPKTKEFRYLILTAKESELIADLQPSELDKLLAFVSRDVLIYSQAIASKYSAEEFSKKMEIQFLAFSQTFGDNLKPLKNTHLESKKDEK